MTEDRKRIIAISGSTRENSVNLNLIHAIIELSSGKLSIKIFKGLSGIPHFNPALDNDQPPKEVSNFQKQLNDANGILICTPEYAMGYQAHLKTQLIGLFRLWNFHTNQLLCLPLRPLVKKYIGLYWQR